MAEAKAGLGPQNRFKVLQSSVASERVKNSGNALVKPLAFPRNEMMIGHMDRQKPSAVFEKLRADRGLILPSLLKCDFGNLQREIARLEEAGVQGLHLDVMDGHFVPNLTYGMPVVEGVRRLTELPIDVHLMISRPSQYIRAFVDAGADCLTFHAEVDEDVPQVLRQIHSAGVLKGLAINPGTPLAHIDSWLPDCDLLLVMSVDAGFGGQAFNPVALEKLRTAHQRYPELLLEVDGGINLETIGQCAEAGARLFVVGSAIFGQASYGEAIDELSAAIES